MKQRLAGLALRFQPLQHAATRVTTPHVSAISAPCKDFVAYAATSCLIAQCTIIALLFGLWGAGCHIRNYSSARSGNLGLVHFLLGDVGRAIEFASQASQVTPSCAHCCPILCPSKLVMEAMRLLSTTSRSTHLRPYPPHTLGWPPRILTHGSWLEAPVVSTCLVCGVHCPAGGSGCCPYRPIPLARVVSLW